MGDLGITRHWDKRCTWETCICEIRDVRGRIDQVDLGDMFLWGHGGTRGSGKNIFLYSMGE